MKSGVYTITNNVTGKIYVGAAVDFKIRRRNHFKELRGNRHINNYLQRAWNKYGEENFKFEILIECEESLIYSEEHYWATVLNVHNKKFGYNNKPTHPHKHAGHSKETVAKMIKTSSKNNGKPVVILNLKGEYVTETPSISEAANYIHGKRRKSSNIWKVLNSTDNVNYCYNHVFVYKDRYDKNKDYSVKMKYRQLIKYNMAGEEVGRFNNCADAARSINIKHNTFVKALEGVAEKEYKGYVWKNA